MKLYTCYVVGMGNFSVIAKNFNINDGAMRFFIDDKLVSLLPVSRTIIVSIQEAPE